MSVTNFFETVAKGIVNDAKKILGLVPKIQGEAATIQPVITAVLAELAPEAVPIENAVYAGAGLIFKAMDDLGAAAVAKFLNIDENSQVLTDIKSILPTIKSVAAAKGQIPATPAA